MTNPLTCAARPPEKGDVIFYVVPAFPPLMPSPSYRVVVFRGWYSGNRRAFYFMRRPGDWHDLEDEGVSLSPAGHHLLENGVYVSRADGGTLIMEGP